MINKMQLISVAFADVNPVKFAYSAGTEDRIYGLFAEKSVNGPVLTNGIVISKKA